STGGSVSLRAGQDVALTGTDVIAARDIQVAGNTVTIDPGYDTRRQSQTMEQKTAGLTVALSGVVGSALNSAIQAIQAVREQSDSRLQALQGMKAVLSGYQAYQGTQVDTNNKGASSFVGISVSLGAQRVSSSQTSEQSQSFASTLNAGHDISVVARQGDITAVGSQLKAANNVELNASRAINLLSARNTESMTGSNSSSGGNIGVSFGLSGNSAGFSVFANVNAAKGRELGSGNSWSETTVDAGQQVGLTSGGDTRLTGAQVSGERIVANVGGDLLLKSQQDSNRYDSKQTSVSAGGSFTFGSMTGSGYLSASQDKMHSSFDSVQQQSGLFAGTGGYDIHVGNHTQLDGAVIGSTAGADKNRLDTGTLGFSNIDNRAEFSVSHSGVGLSASPSLSMSDMLKSAALTAPSALMSMGRGGNAGSTTYAAVSDGALVIRNQAGQQQDIAALSRDVAHANNALSPIFDKEKEQKRLQTAQRVGELGAQVMDVVRTEGEIRAVRAAEARGDVKRPADNASEKDWDKYKKDLTETADYKAVMASYGTGSDLQRATQAATAAIQALAGGGNLQQALAGASAPYLAQLVKDVTMPVDEKKATASDIAANAMGHALMGAVVAQLSGKDAVSGAVGAASGELTARLLIMKELYSGRDTSDLTEAEKQSVSALASLAAGLASGIASGNTTGAATGAQAGRNAVENNALGDGFSLPSGLTNYGQSVASLWNNTNLTDENGNVLNPVTDAEKQDGMHKLVTGVMPEGQDISKAIVNGYTSGALIAGGWYFGPIAGTAGVIGGGTLSAATDVAKQFMTMSPTDKYSYSDTAIAFGTGALTQGRNSVLMNMFINSSGAYIGSIIKGEDPTAAMLGNAVGTYVGDKVGSKFTQRVISHGYSSDAADVGGTVIGGVASAATDYQIEKAMKHGGSEK
ncbi:hemagglutinin repeat-containing protein, partial [Dickeya sp. ws52]|uniref:hemagglutinin repeat-containing protein n=1 Tax=Dickeya sp. ws52 TaxID=2576377 RepID=UPI00351AE0D8